MRIIEVARSIIKANDGFRYIYSQLRERVYVRGERLMMKDMMDLSMAIKSYKEISTSIIR